MPRPSFTMSGRGYTVIQGNGGFYQVQQLADARIVSEQIGGGVKRRKPSGWIPPVGYSFLRDELTSAEGNCRTYISNNNWTRYDGTVGKSSRFQSVNHFNECVTATTARQTLDTSAAIYAARKKMKNSNVNLGVAYAERKATSRMLGDTATRMARAVRALRRGEFRNAARALGITHDPGRPRGSNWTNHWLQLQYGWKPMLSDVYGSCSALSKRDNGDWIVTAKASRTDTSSWYTERLPTGSTSPTNNFDAFSCRADRQRGVFVRIDATPSNDLTMSLSSLGITNPLLIAWEVVPYSFVVDWFLPVGSWLESLDALLGYTNAYTSVTTYTNTVWNEWGRQRKYPNGTYVINDFNGNRRLVEVVRTATYGAPMPAFPRFKDPWSLGHMANGLSLLTQAFGR